MGKFTDLLKDFIESIPDAKLTGFPTQAGPIWKNSEFRLDMRGVRGGYWPMVRYSLRESHRSKRPSVLVGQMTTDGKFNLQIQANKGAKATSIRKFAPRTAAGPVIVGQDAPAEEVRNMFLEKMVKG
jgi:hypothetical protein